MRGWINEKKGGFYVLTLRNPSCQYQLTLEAVTSSTRFYRVKLCCLELKRMAFLLHVSSS
jgi:hypothetical protein